MDTTNDQSSQNMTFIGMTTSIWLIYVVIVFEIIFMISPAAFYYYSVYGLPLNWLTENPSTSWLVQYILPHFTAHQSTVGTFLIAISWPLIIFGLLMFLWGFVQIYYAKFTGKGAVSSGLYRYIRHPQYTALAIIGLGTTFFWSRFLVLIAFLTMMFLYAILARVEEQRCLRLFGDPYDDYLQRTGRFLPKVLADWLPDLPKARLRFFGMYLVTLVAVLAGGWWLKLHVISQMNIQHGENVMAISLAPMKATLAQSVFGKVESLLPSDQGRLLLYIVPGSWSIPELGIHPKAGYQNSSRSELAHPTMHGNLPDYDGSQFYVLVTKPSFRTEHSAAVEDIIRIQPLLRISIDLATGEADIDSDLQPGKWSAIPVPVY